MNADDSAKDNQDPWTSEEALHRRDAARKRGRFCIGLKPDCAENAFRAAGAAELAEAARQAAAPARPRIVTQDGKPVFA